MTATEFTIPRSGMPPLRFPGELIAEVAGERQGGRDQNRWHEIRAYRAESGRYVLAIAYRTRWQGETDNFHAEACESPAAVIDALDGYSPLAHVQGYPPGEAYREKQRRLEDDLRRRWGGLLTEFYSQLGDDFAERV